MLGVTFFPIALYKKINNESFSEYFALYCFSAKSMLSIICVRTLLGNCIEIELCTIVRTASFLNSPTFISSKSLGFSGIINDNSMYTLTISKW